MKEIRYGFTLIEMLVVIAIITLLASLLFPALSRIKNRALRTVCLSNQRQIGFSLALYAHDWEDRLPPMDYPRNHFNASHNFYLQQSGRWLGLGRLFDTKVIEEPKHFYCPSQRSGFFSYPDAWENPKIAPSNSRLCGYFYRIFDQSNPPVITEVDVDELNNLRYSNIEHMIALTANIFGPTWWRLEESETWPHRNPLGVNAAFSDGHASWVDVPEEEYDRAIIASDAYRYAADDYVFLFFQALDNGDFSILKSTFPLP